MKATQNIKRISIETVCVLYVVLFVYAAVSKLLDFENFQVQLGQSPLMSAFAGWVSYLVPVLEIIISIFLAVPTFRKAGLYCSFMLMAMFSAYIFIMINFSPFVPCSCGGILEKMGWNTHLYFNLAFLLLGALGIMLLENDGTTKQPYLKSSLRLLLLAVGSAGFIFLVYISSEKMTHQRNNFTRRFPHHPTKFIKEMDMGFNSYYIAGTTKDKVYLGNRTAPLTVTEIDSALGKKKVHVINIPKTDKKYRSLTLTVAPPYFYIWDGTEAFVYRGSTINWKATIWIDQKAFFTAFAPISGNRSAIRAISSTTKENVLGSITVKDSIAVQLNHNLLNKQIDGLFDTDGTLLYNNQYHKIIYTYYYRNQYVIADTLMTTKTLGKTIDTTSRAAIKVKYVKSLQGSKISVPVVTVNKRTATYGKYLYIHAGLLGKYEPREVWDSTSIIDVYDFTTNTYSFSFYIDDKMKNKIKDFRIENNLIYTLSGNYLRAYRFKKGFY
ncbi:DoxX family protein [Flavobacterium sp. GT3P67]|uniref:DoxX family protein n=1 Tax=Flavobacterium sp. GT3P67 TaxID=2541722 RepID=UPI0010509CED|nr:MauE/DoxX family redox-associated membrane protein [Flavobacterium sp. GT3P67]TDE52736.1 hypothetical protein E0H99_11475 [Flavobacterium sp. GT3P67]